MLKSLKNSTSPLHLVSALAIAILAVAAATDDTVTLTATGAFSELNTLSEAAPTPETNSEETDTVDLQQGLQGYWRFDDPEVSRGKSLDFDGSDDYVDNPISGLGEEENYTLSIWVRAEDWSSGRQEFLSGEENSSTNKPLDWGINPSGELSHWRGDSAGQVLNYSVSNVNGWHHVVFIENKSHVAYYFDGERVDLKNFETPYTPTGNFEIGRGDSYGSSGAEWTGQVDNIRAYDRVLETSEVQDLYEERPVSREGLVLHQDFNEGPNDCDLTSSTACLSDESGEGNDGTPQGFDDNDFNTGSGWFNETPLNRPTVKDYSNNTHTGRFYGGNNGELQNFALNQTSGWKSGFVGESALEFDGRDDQVSLPDDILDVGKGSFTFSVWFKTNEDYDGGCGPQNIFQTSDLGGLWNEHGDLEFWGKDGSGNSKTLVSGPDWTNLLGDRVFASVVRENDTWKLYVNGSLADSYQDPDGIYNISSSNTFIGGHLCGSSPYFNGTIDDLQIYHRALSSSEIKKIYQEKQTVNGIKFRWNFEAGDRKTAYDSSSLRRKGILGSKGFNIDGSEHLVFSDFNLDSAFTLSAWMKQGKSNWKFKKSVKLKEASVTNKGVFEYVNISLNSGLSSSSPEDEIVVYEVSSGEEVASNVLKYHQSGEEWAIVAFNATIRKNRPKRYNIYYGNPSPPTKEKIFNTYSVDFRAAGNDWDSSNPVYYWARNGSYVSGPNWNAPSATNSWQNWTDLNLFNMVHAKELDKIVEEGKSREDVSGDDTVIVRNIACNMEKDQNFIGSNPPDCSNGSSKHFGLYIVHSLTYNSGCYSVNPFTLTPSEYDYQKNLSDIPHSLSYYVYPEASSYGTWTEHCDPNIAAFDDDTYTILPLRNLAETEVGDETVVGLSKSGSLGIARLNKSYSSLGGETVSSDVSRGWKNILLTSSGNFLKMYVNGELREEKTIESLKTNSRNLKFGDILGYEGAIDELRIYNRSLSQKEIQRLAFQ